MSWGEYPYPRVVRYVLCIVRYDISKAFDSNSEMNITPIEVLSAAEIHVRVWAPIKSKKKMKNPSMFVYLVIKLHHKHFGL